MNYELAKQLKDAGFDNWIVGKEYPMLLKPYSEPMYEAGLSELIEACGDDLSEMENTYDGWRVYPNIQETKIEPIWSKSLKEALAQLWLALNKKI